jgi:hypothetical protein
MMSDLEPETVELDDPSYRKATLGLAERLKGLDDWQWDAVHDALLALSSQPFARSLSPRVLDRVGLALSGEAEEIDNDLTVTFIFVLRTGLILQDPEFATAVGNVAMRRMLILRKTFGDWIFDMIRADLDGHRNWMRLRVEPITRVEQSPNRHWLEIEVDLLGGDTVELEMPVVSAVRLVRSLVRNIADLPEGFITDEADEALEEIESAVGAIRGRFSDAT